MWRLDCGRKKGRAKSDKLVEATKWDDAESVKMFLAAVDDALHTDQREVANAPLERNETKGNIVAIASHLPYGLKLNARTMSDTKTPYEQLSDLKKLRKQWHKLARLHTREEWSAAIVRAATAAEIAANHAIRQEFSARSKFDDAFVDNLLIWANGLNGKLSKLLIPLANGTKKETKMKALKKLADAIAQKRNAIAHQGEFCNEDEAKLSIDQARDFITGLVQLYDSNFQLKKRTET